jgi:hypothetical protein
MQRQKRGGARVCVVQENHDYTPADVIAGRVQCGDHFPIKVGMTE